MKNFLMGKAVLIFSIYYLYFFTTFSIKLFNNIDNKRVIRKWIESKHCSFLLQIELSYCQYGEVILHHWFYYGYKFTFGNSIWFRTEGIYTSFGHSTFHLFTILNTFRVLKTYRTLDRNGEEVEMEWRQLDWEIKKPSRL